MKRRRNGELRALDAIVAPAAAYPERSRSDRRREGFYQRPGCSSPSRQMEPGEILSIRGVGKFLFSRNGGQTKKGRISVTFLNTDEDRRRNYHGGLEMEEGRMQVCRDGLPSTTLS
ncbi:MAG: hypothetical protein ACLU8D_12765 [Enterocloster sp.]